jgi:hypothetical protein
MLGALEQLRAGRGLNFEFEVADIDADPLLLSRYDELVPVLVAIEGTDVRELCHYFLDNSAVLAYLNEVG